MTAGTLVRRNTGGCALVTLCAVLGMLSGCGTTLVDGVKQLRAEVVSPQFVLQDSNSIILSAGGILQFPDTMLTASADLVLTITNPGPNDLVVDFPGSTITMGTSTEAASFSFVIPPSGPLSVATGTSAHVTLSFDPSLTVGTKTATVVIPTNDVNNASFTFTVTGGGTALTAPSVPANLRCVQLTSGTIREIDTSLSISWNATAGAASYVVSRFDGSDVLIQDLPETGATSCIDTGLIAGTLYKYSVAAKNSVGSSPASSHVAQTVPGVASTSVSLSTTSTKISGLTDAYCSVGDLVAVTATVLPGGSVPTTTWASSNSAVATVDAYGNIFAVASGPAIISATSQDNKGTTSSFTISVIKIGEATGQVGLVFYDKGDYVGGWRYMEAALSDQSASTYWASGPFTAPTSQLVETGAANTTAIKAAATAAGKTPWAANFCTDLTGVPGWGKNDWFLPSIDELTQMYTKLKLNGLGSFNAGGYWSSSWAEQRPAYCNVWCRYFSTDYVNIYSDNVGSQFYVRAARRF